MEGGEQAASRGHQRGDREGPFQDLEQGRGPDGQRSGLERPFRPQLRRGFCRKLLVTRNATAGSEEAERGSTATGSGAAPGMPEASCTCWLS